MVNKAILLATPEFSSHASTTAESLPSRLDVLLEASGNETDYGGEDHLGHSSESNPKPEENGNSYTTTN